MKRRFSVFTALLCIILFAGCEKGTSGVLMNDNVDEQTSARESKAESQQDSLAGAPENTQESSSETDEESESIMEVFQSVLLNKRTFSCTDMVSACDTNVIHEFNGLLSEMFNIDAYSERVCRFAVVDMDGDSAPEVVLELEDYTGYIILRYVEGQIRGNFLGYRAMSSIKENGTFGSENSAFEVHVNKLYFIGDTVVADRKISWLMSNYDKTSYRIDDLSVGEEDYERANALYEECPEVEWHDYTEEEVNKFIVEDFSPIETAKETANERQAYLDSLSYLLDLTYDQTRKAKEEFQADAKSYYDNCFNEMKRIYKLCKERLTGEELETLIAEQQRWEGENGKEPEEDIFYYEYGDMAFRRTLRMINMYYSYEFYNWTHK